MMAKVKLYGHLGKRFGREFHFDIETIDEAMRALNANLKGFRAYLIEHSEPGYRVIVNGRAIGEEELQFGVNTEAEIKIVPVVLGAGSGKAIGQIILGVVLAVVAVVAQQYWALAGVASWAAGGVASAGVAMIAGGATQLLSPGTASTNLEKKSSQSQNFGFQRAEDNSYQGYPVPIGYGTMMVEGYPVSVRVTVEN